MPVCHIDAIAGTEFPAGRRTRVIVGPNAPTEAAGFVMGHVTLYPGGSVPAHAHAQEEVYFIISGEGTIELNDELTKVCAGSYIHIPSHVRHCLTNTTAENMQMLFCYAPKSIVEHWQQELEQGE